MKFVHMGRAGRSLHSCAAHCHDGWELVYNLQGSGTTVIDGVAYPFRPGSIFLIPSGAMHSKVSEDGFTDCYARITELTLPQKVYTAQDDQQNRIGMLLRVLELTWHEEGTSSVCRDLLHSIIGLLQFSVSASGEDKHVQMLRHQLIQRFNDPDLILKDLLKDIPVNGDYLSRLFKQQHGMTPHEYLTKLRLDHAAYLLRDDGVSVSEAAFRSGFYDPLYFSRLFRRHKGVPPSQW